MSTECLACSTPVERFPLPPQLVAKAGEQVRREDRLRVRTESEALQIVAFLTNLDSGDWIDRYYAEAFRRLAD
jgi:hypothetical protein